MRNFAPVITPAQKVKVHNLHGSYLTEDFTTIGHLVEELNCISFSEFWW